MYLCKNIAFDFYFYFFLFLFLLLISRHKNNNVETWKVLKDIICRKQSHFNKLPDVFIDNNR